MENEIKKESLLNELKTAKAGLLHQLIKEVGKGEKTEYKELTEEEKKEEDKFLKKFRKLFV